LLKRYKRALRAAGLRPLRFHDLRHTCGTTMIRKADIVRVQTWMGHADMERRASTCISPRARTMRGWSPRRSQSRATVGFSQHPAIFEKQASEEGR
jgi:integrase